MINMKFVIFAFLAFGLWMLANYPIIGQILLVAYVIIFWRSISSHQLLKVFLGTLAIVFVAVTIKNYQATIAFATYSYALLIAVALVLVKELRRSRIEAQRQQKEDNA
jgi:hypothetical protein